MPPPSPPSPPPPGPPPPFPCPPPPSGTHAYPSGQLSSPQPDPSAAKSPAVNSLTTTPRTCLGSPIIFISPQSAFSVSRGQGFCRALLAEHEAAPTDVRPWSQVEAELRAGLRSAVPKKRSFELVAGD
ncbi:MAG: hypothetical protein IPM79_09315 [Polyangiaceae bacterium]|nr:hypothetical protein [Polyangiaceae bacterium]